MRSLGRVQCCRLERHFKCLEEEGGEARVEDAQVLRAGDAVALVFEDDKVVGYAVLLEGYCDSVDVLRRDVRVLRALDDQEVPLDCLYEVDRGPFTVTVGDIFGGTAHHLLAVGSEVGARGVVVECEVGHTADRGCGGDDLGLEVRDRPPRRVFAVGGACNANASRLCHIGIDQRLDPAPYVFLLPTAPAVLLYRLLERETEPRAAPVVRRQHVEAPRGQVLDLGVEPVFGVASRAAVDQHDGSKLLAGCTVEPTLYLYAVHRPPAEVFGGDEPLRTYASPSWQARKTGRFAVLSVVVYEVHGVKGVVVSADPVVVGLGQRYEVAPRVL